MARSRNGLRLVAAVALLTLIAGVGIVARLGHARFDDASETDLDYDEAYFRLGLEQRF